MEWFWIFVSLLAGAGASHFRGGIIQASPLFTNNNTLKITIRMSYRRNHIYAGKCDEDVIKDGEEVGHHPEAQGLKCVIGCPKQDELVSLIRYVCTGFSRKENWEYGERTLHYSFPNATMIKLSAKGCCWVAPFGSGSWDLFIKMDLAVRTDTNKINASPSARFFPVIQIQEGCNSSIAIRPYDPDGDVVRCRWGNKSECAGICNGFPGAVLDEATCTLTYQSKGGDLGYKAVALMMEDFAGTDTQFRNAFSTVALNFLVKVSSLDTNCSIGFGDYVSPTPFDKTCIAIPPEATYAGRIQVDSQSSFLSVVEIKTLSPVGLHKSQLTRIGFTNVYYINISWTPTTVDYYLNNNNIESMCYSALISNDQSLTQRCIQWMAGVEPPRVVPDSVRGRNTLVHPVDPSFEITFDQSIVKPSHSSKFIIKDILEEKQVYSIDINSKQGNETIQFLTGNTVRITSRFRFEEKRNFSVMIEGGFAKGTIGCGPESEAFPKNETWQFETMDISPPVVTFLQARERSNGSTLVKWSVDEEVEYTMCRLTTDTGEVVIGCPDCSATSWYCSGQTQGVYVLNITVSDTARNVASKLFKYVVDLTPPVVEIEAPFKGYSSNLREVTFQLECLRKPFCRYECLFGRLNQKLISLDCQGGSLGTGYIQTEGQYTVLVSATDDVGNMGENATFSWDADFTPPTILNISDGVSRCDDEISTVAIPEPTVTDNTDPHPHVQYKDHGDRSQCSITREWMATDAAGNEAVRPQRVTLTPPPLINLQPQLLIPCDPDKTLVTPEKTANAENVCSRNVTLTYVDSVPSPTCPGSLNRTWFATDGCTPNSAPFVKTQVLNFYSICPSSSCGRNNEPPRGACVQGKCLCFSPWSGEDCSVQSLEPIIVPVTDVVLKESELYEKNMELIQGSEPVYWKIVDGPVGLKINPRTGFLEWQANTFDKNHIKVMASNSFGTNISSWNISVIPGYDITLNKLKQRTFYTAVPVTLTGRIVYRKGNLVEDLHRGHVPVDVCIEYQETTRKYQTFTQPDKTFLFEFKPSKSEYGNYEAKVRHPAMIATSPSVDWKVLGMRFTKSVIVINDETDSTVAKLYTNLTELVNDGPEDLQDVKVVSVRNVPDDIKVELLFDNAEVIPILQIGARIPINIKISAPQAFQNVRIFFTLRTKEGVISILILNAHISYSKPLFVVSPLRLETSVVRGSQTIVQVNITNKGRREATEVFLQIPRIEYLSVISFGNSSYASDKQNIAVGDSLSLVLQISSMKDSQLGRYVGAIGIEAKEINSNFPIDFKIISNAKAEVTFRIEDEFTYFAETAPLVKGARVRIYNQLRGTTLIQTDDIGNGMLTFTDIPEGMYDLNVEAPRHEGINRIYVFTPGGNTIRVFLKRIAVTYHWTVTPTKFQDEYQISIEADFETRVPMPVVTVTPISIKLEPLELGLIDNFELNITNHGLIRADRFSFSFPKNHPTLEFEVVAEFEVLEARTFKILPVRVLQKAPGRRRRGTCGGTSAIINFGYECGGPVNKALSVAFKSEPGTCGHFGSGSGGSGTLYFCCGGAAPSGRSACNPCLQSVFNCLLGFTPLGPLTCSLEITKLGLKIALEQAEPSDFIGPATCATKTALGAAFPPLGIAFTTYDCIKDIIPACSRTPGSRRKRDVRDQLILNFAKSVEPLNVLIKWKLEVFGKQVWLSSDDEYWFEAYFIPSVSDRSEQGPAITHTEYDMVMTADPPGGVMKQDVADFLMRWNNTVFDWRNGKTEPTEAETNRMSYSKFLTYKSEFLRLNQDAEASGYKSVIEQYNDRAEAFNTITTFDEEEGVCAVVRIRIEQELALTREGFLAKLEIDNGDISTLKDIDVKIRIRNAENGVESTALFSIGNGTVGGDIRVDRSLAMQHQGEITWLIIPYLEAAPIDDKYYDVGGILYYEVDGNRVTVPLLPARITVRPDPLLFVHYFWEKFVISDDPFTEQVETAIPFSLAVAVRNGGNGTAHNLRITSSQPEIIENEKGLLVNFKIIGANIGSMSVEPSLSVRFGDVLPDRTVTASWWMVSSLKGIFQNYSATFENQNPLGDERLSLLEELEIHELIHYVRIVDEEVDDGIKDFLVNDNIDYNIYPDKVFSSYSLQNYDVDLQNTSLIRINNEGNAIHFFLESLPSKKGFCYYRFETELPILELVSVNSHLFQRNVNTVKELPPENAWFTSQIGERTSKVLIGHMLDYIVDVGVLHQYNITVNLTTLTESAITLRPTEPPLNVTLIPDVIIGRITMPTPKPTPKPTPTPTPSNAVVITWHWSLLLVCLFANKLN